MEGISEEDLARDQELMDAIVEASTAEQITHLHVLLSEPEMLETNRERWGAQKRVVAALRAEHMVLHRKFRQALDSQS
jgi:hypothetical protein